MARDSDRHKLFTRRVAFLGGAKLALGLTLVGRMYYLQVVEADRYRQLAEDNRISLRLIPPPRGRIVDRNGEPLAINQQNFRVLVVSEQAENLDATLDALSRILPLSDHERQRIHRDVKRHRRFVPVTVRENLTWEDMARIEVNAPDLPGVLIDEGLSRYYPHEEQAAHVLGYVASVSEKDLTGDPLLELPGFRIGKQGIEKVHDLALRGTGGTSQVEVNAVGRVKRELKRQEGQPGAEVTLTLDMRLQRFAADRLGDESGAVVVMDVHTGEVLTMVSTPSFDPNAFNRGLSNGEWRDLINNPRHPLNNKAIAGQYAPGSTFKMVVALAALEAGVVTPSTRVYCSGHIELGNARFHCWKKTGHGSQNMVEAIMNSCDVYFYEVAKRVGINRIAAMARHLGLGEEQGIDLPGESGGLIPTKEWKKTKLKEPWQQGETLIAGIGQGYVLATPLQLAVMAARLANGGFAVQPFLTRDLSIEENAAVKEASVGTLGLNQSNLDVVKAGMNAVMNVPGGTAYRARLRLPDVTMAGKTGTSQVRRISMRERETGVKKNDELPWEERDHALFVAFAPVEAPRYAVAVVVEHGGSGSGTAAPIARDVMEQALMLSRRESARRDDDETEGTAG